MRFRHTMLPPKYTVCRFMIVPNSEPVYSCRLKDSNRSTEGLLRTVASSPHTYENFNYPQTNGYDCSGAYGWLSK